MTTKNLTIEGVMHDVGIERAGDAEVIGASINMDGDLVVTIRDLSRFRPEEDDLSRGFEEHLGGDETL